MGLHLLVVTAFVERRCYVLPIYSTTIAFNAATMIRALFDVTATVGITMSQIDAVVVDGASNIRFALSTLLDAADESTVTRSDQPLASEYLEALRNERLECPVLYCRAHMLHRALTRALAALPPGLCSTAPLVL